MSDIAPRVYAQTSVVTSKTGRVSLVHVVRCPYEVGAWHLHRSPLTFSAGRRASPCKGGPYHLVTGVLGIVREAA